MANKNSAASEAQNTEAQETAETNDIFTRRMSVEEFKEALQQGKYSNLGEVFNESLHTSFAVRMFSRLRFEPRISKVLAAIQLLSIPFDPLTGKPTKEYNQKTPFRPYVEPAAFLMNIKAMCHEDPELKRTYMDVVNYDGSWDTSPTEEFTANDRKILFVYRRPLSASFVGAKIQSPAITGERFGGTYLLDTKQDPLTGEYTGDISTMHRLAALGQAMMKLEIKSFNSAIENKTADCISLTLGRHFLSVKSFNEIKNVDDEAAKTIRMQIRSSYPVSGVSPTVVMPLLQFDLVPLKGEYFKIVDDPANTGETIDELLPQFRVEPEWAKTFLATDKFQVIDKVNEICGNYFPKDPSRKKERNEESDVYANFVMLEYITNNTATQFDDAAKMAAARELVATSQRTPWYNARRKSWEHQGLKTFVNEILPKFYTFAAMDDFIKQMPSLMFDNYKVVNESLTDRAMNEFRTTFNMGEEFAPLFTTEIKSTHNKILMELWPEDFADSLDDETLEHIESGKGEELFEQMVQNASGTDAEMSQDDKEELADSGGNIEADLLEIN